MEHAIDDLVVILKKLQVTPGYLQYHAALSYAILLSEQIIKNHKKGNKIDIQLTTLDRIVSDSLPWDDHLLRAWNKVLSLNK